MKKITDFIRRQKFLIISVLIGLLIAPVLVQFFRLIWVVGESMEPTFRNGDVIAGSRVRENTELSVGDIIVFEQEGRSLVKRITATPGMSVVVQDGKTYRRLVLEENQYYVMGDNREVSRDSRIFGPITRDQIQCKYERVCMPWWLFLIVAFCVVNSLSHLFSEKDHKKKANSEIPAVTKENGAAINESHQEKEENDMFTDGESYVDRLVHFLLENQKGQDAFVWKKEGERSFSLPIRGGRLRLWEEPWEKTGWSYYLNFAPEGEGKKEIRLSGEFYKEPGTCDSELCHLCEQVAEKTSADAEAVVCDLKAHFPLWAEMADTEEDPA